MRRRSLPPSAAAVLDIVVDGGARSIHANDLELRMYERGFNSRAVRDALKAFERRSWLVQAGSKIEITEAAFVPAPAGPKKMPRARRSSTRLPRGLFTSDPT
jgi:hypothetical protein